MKASRRKLDVWKMHSGRCVPGEISLSFDSRIVRTARRLLPLLLVGGLLVGQGCGGRKPRDPKKDALATQTDAMGRVVSVREYPRRIVSTAPSNTEMLLSLGLRDKLVGVTSFYRWPENVRGVTRIGGYINPSVDRIISLDPDLVLAARGNSKDAIQQLRRRGIKVFTLDTRTVSGLLVDIRKVGALTGAGEGAGRLVRELEKEVSDVRQKTGKLSGGDKPRVFWIGQEHPLRTAGPGSLVDELIEIAGGTNVAGDQGTRWPSCSMEKLVLRDPEVVILSEDRYRNSPADIADTIARFKRDAVWGRISAVREGRVHFIPADLLGQPSPAFVEGLKLLARHLHSYLFAEDIGEITGNHTEKGSD